ncbi:MAG: hypothetical protein PHT58_03795 [Eubacteriales bacterium]|nr:hypothetical protein [Eubacteriales bacterium]
MTNVTLKEFLEGLAREVGRREKEAMQARKHQEDEYRAYQQTRKTHVLKWQKRRTY